MASTTDSQDSQQQETDLDRLLNEHLNALRIKCYSPYTLRGRRVHIRLFVRWCRDIGRTKAAEITSAILERYQQYVFDYRKRDGQPLAAASRHSRLVPLRVWFRWMARQHFIADNPAGELDLPKIGRPLPRNILSAAEAERVLAQTKICTPIGLRDRAILEVLYSTGIRRLELARLKMEESATPPQANLCPQREGRQRSLRADWGSRRDLVAEISSPGSAPPNDRQ